MFTFTYMLCSTLNHIQLLYLTDYCPTVQNRTIRWMTKRPKSSKNVLKPTTLPSSDSSVTVRHPISLKKTWRKSLPFRASNGVNSNPVSATIFLYYIFEIKMLIFAVKSNENGHFMPFISIFLFFLRRHFHMSIGVFRDNPDIIGFVIYSRIWWASFFRPICPFIALKYE